MQKILLLSDTHGHIDDLILKHVKWADEVWHAGDIGNLIVTDTIKNLKPLKAVFGNIDGNLARSEFKLNEIFMCENMKIVMTHIGGYPGKYNALAKQLILENKPNIFICGHSHILKVQFDKTLNCLHLNPGACGKSGFHLIRTMMRFCITDTKIHDLEIIEIGNR